MPLNVRSIAVSIAVICFFVAAIVAWASGLSSFTCSKRAVTAAVLGYIAAALTVKAVNAILIGAMAERQIGKQKEQTSAGES